MDGFSPEQFVKQQSDCDEAMRPFVAAAKALRVAASDAGLDGNALLAVAIANDSGGMGAMLGECLSKVLEIGGYPEKPSSQTQQATPKLRKTA